MQKLQDTAVCGVNYLTQDTNFHDAVWPSSGSHPELRTTRNHRGYARVRQKTALTRWGWVFFAHTFLDGRFVMATNAVFVGQLVDYLPNKLLSGGITSSPDRSAFIQFEIIGNRKDGGDGFKPFTRWETGLVFAALLYGSNIAFVNSVRHGKSRPWRPDLVPRWCLMVLWHTP